MICHKWDAIGGFGQTGDCCKFKLISAANWTGLKWTDPAKGRGPSKSTFMTSRTNQTLPSTACTSVASKAGFVTIMSWCRGRHRDQRTATKEGPLLCDSDGVEEVERLIFHTKIMSIYNMVNIDKYSVQYTVCIYIYIYHVYTHMIVIYDCICIIMWSNHAFRLPSSFIIQLFSLSLMMSCILLGVLDIEQLEAVEWHPNISNRMLQYCKQWQRCRNAQHFLASRGSNPLVAVVAVFSSLFLN